MSFKLFISISHTGVTSKKKIVKIATENLKNITFDRNMYILIHVKVSGLEK